MARPILVHGFGPFLEVEDNPAARLACAVDGASIGGRAVVGEEIPVSYARGPAASIARARALDAALLIGVGVARSRSVVCVESRAVPLGHEHLADVDGVQLARLAARGARSVQATGPVSKMAAALSGVVSADAGRYVCNAWLYQTVRALGEELPVLFLHVPPPGLAPEQLLAALETIEGSLHGG
ncbi:MAG: hypothetical protein VX265_02890 [Myxococcota bacterium]|nr:hypothetical protein [Myxococcota bacterium]